MKIICDKNILSENITIVQKAVSAKTTLPILECIYIGTVANEHGGSNSIKVISNDLHLAIEANNISCNVLEQGCVAISARLFSDIIRKLPEGEITITSDNRNVTLITAGKSEFKILGLAGEEFPFLTDVSRENNYSIDCYDFKELIRQTIFSVSSEDTRAVMTGELISFNDKYITVAALDGFRIAVSSRKYENAEFAEKSAVIPAKTLSELAKILPSDNAQKLEIFFSERHALFEHSNYRIVTRLIDGSFVNFEHIFKTEAKTFMRVNRLEICESLERIMLISTDVKKIPARLKLSGMELTITSNSDFGTVHEEIAANIKGIGENAGETTVMEIGFNPKYLLDAFKVMDDEIVTFELTTPLSQAVIRADGNENYKFLILPLRLKN